MRIGELTRSGFKAAPAADLSAIQHQFSSRHYARLEGLVDPWLLEHWAASVACAPFRTRAHHDAEYWGGEPPVDHVIDAAEVLGRILFAVNDPALFRTVEQVSGCGPIGCFHGVVYRLTASTGDRDRFHGDMDGNRLAALSINLGREPYAGGHLEMRAAGSDSVTERLDNTTFGGALLFELSDALEHRVGGVETGPPRTVFSGWFQREPRYADWLSGASSKGRF